MNHLSDTKKVSDTPRTDAHLKAQVHTYSPSVEPDFAYRLERELNAANVEIERLTQKVSKLYEGAEEQKQHIKRLEEAGDYLCAAAAFMGWHDKIETWNKAKEAKP
jgi:hypothetical protein